MADTCCELLRGEAFIGPALLANGGGLDTTGWGVSWGTLYGGGAWPAGLARPPLPAPMRSLGNAEITLSNDIQEIKGVTPRIYQGNQCSDRILQGIKIKVVLHCLSRENLAIALGSSVTSSPGAAVANEIIPSLGNIPDEQLIPFARGPVDVESPITLELYDFATSTASPLVEGTEWVRSPAGAISLGISIPAGKILRASYTAVAVDGYTVSDLCSCKSSIKLVAKNMHQKGCGATDTNTGNVIFDFYRVTLDTTSEYDLLPDNTYTAITLEGYLERVRYNTLNAFYWRGNV